ncbi:MAG: class I SAM-dependent methyltransferase, partial [Deltaproteobacteria bacterium]|nr:class I SAM-dependent methyltransferase [Deltaproteobacteria bacterium]
MNFVHKVEKFTRLISRRKWGRNRHQKYGLAKWVSDADLLRAIVEETRGLARDATVVELGCGLGHVAAAFVGVAAKCVGVDYDINMLKRAVNKEKIQYIHSRIEEISDLSADVVLARNVMHYVAAHELFG